MLTCEFCDSTLENGTTTCPNCGGIVTDTAAQAQEAPVEYPDIPAQESEKTVDTSKILKTAAAAVGVAAGVSLLGGLFKRKTGHPPMMPHIGKKARARHPRMGSPGGLSKGGPRGGHGRRK